MEEERRSFQAGAAVDGAKGAADRAGQAVSDTVSTDRVEGRDEIETSGICC